MESKNIKLSKQNIWGWILFVPVSIIASAFSKYLMDKLSGGILKIFSPLLEQIISGFLTSIVAAIVLIFVAYKIIPNNKKLILKIYSLILTIVFIVWTIFVYFLSKEGIVGSFWYPLLLNIGFFAGIWGTYLNLFYLNEKEIE